jgi:predicted SnoaL-like aldol condensation-catalyzing enzyme
VTKETRVGQVSGVTRQRHVELWHDLLVEAANKELVRAYTRAVFDLGDVSAVDRYLAPDFFNHVTGRSGTEDFKRLATELGSTERSNVIEFMVAEGNLVVAFMTITRTVPQNTTIFGQAIEGGPDQSYTVHHVHIYRVAEGKIREHWALRDDISMLRQLGAI